MASSSTWRLTVTDCISRCARTSHFLNPSLQCSLSSSRVSVNYRRAKIVTLIWEVQITVGPDGDGAERQWHSSAQVTPPSQSQMACSTTLCSRKSSTLPCRQPTIWGLGGRGRGRMYGQPSLKRYNFGIQYPSYGQPNPALSHACFEVWLWRRFANQAQRTCATVRDL